MNTTISLITKAGHGDKLAEEILVSKNMPLVHSCVKKLIHEGLDYDDLLQLGSIGLIKAIRRFNTDYNVEFSTYAVPLIMGEIRRFLRDDGMVKVSRSLKEIKKKVLTAHSELSAKLNREPTIGEIAEVTEIPQEKIIMALEACAPCESLEKPLYPDATGEIKLADTIPDTTHPSDELEKIALKTALANLKPRDRKIIILRYFKGKTQAEVSKFVGVSQVQVSRCEKKILESLKAKLQ